MAQNRLRSKRLRLDNYLKTLTPNVYFQPPASIMMSYPAIRYRRSSIDANFADNLPYQATAVYELIVIDRDPDSDIVEELSKQPKTIHVRHYTSDNLNHDVFRTYV